MNIQKVTDASFRKYGKVLEGYDFSELLKEMKHTPVPEDVVYVPGVEELEALPVAKDLQNKAFGGLPIQVGYCNGHNKKLNAVEYHRNSEINIAVGEDLVLLIGMQQDIEEDFTYDTAKIEAFLLPAGTAIEVYATTLHYAPCGVKGAGFKVGVVLPKGTNYPLDDNHDGWEDKLITAKNKWLIGHPEGGLPEGSPLGLLGENIRV